MRQTRTGISVVVIIFVIFLFASFANADPGISVTPTDLNFIDVFPGCKEYQTVTISSTGTDTLELTAIEFTENWFDAYSVTPSLSSPQVFFMDPGETLDLTVKFLPSVNTFFLATLLISSNAGDVTVSILGDGYGMQGCLKCMFVTPMSHDFGYQIQSDEVYITITNTGIGSMELDFLLDPSQFDTTNFNVEFPQHHCSLVFEEPCSFSISFEPQSPGVHSTTLTIENHGCSSSSVDIPLTGITPNVPWVSETIEENVQAAVDIAVDEPNQVHLCYFVPAGSGARLRYVTGFPLQEPGWIFENVGELVAEASDCAMAVDTDGRVHIAYVADGQLSYARRDEDDWTIQVVEASDISGACSITLDQTDPLSSVPYISYRKLGEELYWAFGEGGTWSTTQIVSGGPGSDLAKFHDIAVDSGGAALVTYSPEMAWDYTMLHLVGAAQSVTPMLDVPPFSHRLIHSPLFASWPFATTGLRYEDGSIVFQSFRMIDDVPQYWDEPTWSRLELFAFTPPTSQEEFGLSLADGLGEHAHIAYYDLETGLRYLATRLSYVLHPCYRSPAGSCNIPINQPVQITEQVETGIVLSDIGIATDSRGDPHIAYLAQVGGAGPLQIRYARRIGVLGASPTLSPLRWRFYAPALDDEETHVRSFVISNFGTEDLEVNEVRIENNGAGADPWRLQLDCDDEFGNPTASPVAPEGFRTFCVGYQPVSGGVHTGTMFIETNAGTLTADLAGVAPLSITVFCPVNVSVKDPDGLVIDNQTNEIPGASYTEPDLNFDGDPDDRISIRNPKNGLYEISLVPEPDALETDTYTLVAEFTDDILTIADNIPVSDIPPDPYIVIVTADGIYLDVDSDGDGIPVDQDNCPDNHNPGQEDTSPPGGNGIGDACECEGNFDCDDDCDGSDAFAFKVDFGRSPLGNPCESGNSCNGDFDCDHDCDGSDAFNFKTDFGRSSFGNPCPTCTVGDWCTYP